MARRLTIAEQLGVNAFQTDRSSHLTLSDPNLCNTCALRPCISVCPAEVYHYESGRLRINHENCVETGACRIACHEFGNRALVWSLPIGGRGVNYRYG